MELVEDNLLNLYPEYDSILGPYSRSDGREHIILNKTTVPKSTQGKTKTISYPKAIMESQIGRRLRDNETVDHRDRDKSNNRGYNIIIIDRSKHSSLDAIKVKVEDVKCIECSKSFTPSSNQHNARSYEHAGPFCSRTCVGKYGAKIQNGGKVMGRSEIKKEYYREEK